MDTRIYIGPAGWSYPDWHGIVYPATTPRGFDALAYVTGYFNLIEINSTFYRVPRPATAASWAERVSHRRDFQFTVKAFHEFTHGASPARRSEIDAFARAVEPLSAKGRLSAVLVQFPWSFRFSPAATRYISDLAAWFAPLATAIEVRHGSWGKPEATAFFVENGIGMCGIDQPQIGESLPPGAGVADGAGAYLRLHGRNRAEWFKPDTNRDRRYDYLYSAEELNEWVERVKRLAREIDRIHVVLNNHFRGQAVANALAMSAMLSGHRAAAPQGIIEAYPGISAWLEEGSATGGAPLRRDRKERSLFDDGNE
jgi:uncharacterized protein YecE (DUF72 family)